MHRQMSMFRTSAVGRQTSAFGLQPAKAAPGLETFVLWTYSNMESDGEGQTSDARGAPHAIRRH